MVRTSASSSRRGRWHEQDQLAVAARGVLEVDDQAVRDLGQLLDDPVELGGAEPHPAAVEGGVAAAGDDAAAVRLEDDPVAVTPDPGVAVEVGVAQPAAVRIAPQAQRHRRHRRRHDELPRLADHLVAVLVERVHVDGEGTSRDHPRPHGQQRVVLHQAAADVGAAAAHVELDVGAELLADPGVPLGRQRCTGGAHDPDPQLEIGQVHARAERQAIRKPGLAPISVAPVSSASRHCHPRSGYAGSPSTITMVAPTRSPETSAFHIIHAVVEYHSTTSPRRGPRRARGSSGARARSPRARARSPSAFPSCPRRRARPGGGRTRLAWSPPAAR